MITAGELAERLGAELEGNPGRAVGAVRPPEGAGPEDLAYLADDRRPPEALAGGPIGKVVDGDRIRITVDRNALSGRIDLVSETADGDTPDDAGLGSVHGEPLDGRAGQSEECHRNE